jgi:exodeoxyribonuclease VII small subunit
MSSTAEETRIDDFEKRLERAKAVLEKLMDPEMTLSDSVKAYEEGMKELKAAQEMLEKAQLQIEQIKAGETEGQR